MCFYRTGYLYYGSPELSISYHIDNMTSRSCPAPPPLVFISTKKHNKYNTNMRISKKYLLVWVIAKFILIAWLMASLEAKAQTSRKAYPDTLRGFSMNVLANDFDPQGDPLKCVRLNSIALYRDSIKITKKDTGVFRLYKDGTFKAFPLPTFFGQVNFNYHMTDGKGGANSKGYIVYKREILKACTPFAVDCSYNDSCKSIINLKYWVKVDYLGEKYYGYIYKDSIPIEGADINGVKTIRKYESYNLRLIGAYMQTMWIDPTTYYYIMDNSCKD